MYIQQIEEDVACVEGWYFENNTQAKANYGKIVLLKIPLLLATLTESQEQVYKNILKQDNWRKVGWYPSCHYEVNAGPKVSLFCKEQVEQPRPFKKTDNWYSFNEYVPLGCSCNSYKTRVALTRVADRCRTLGVHRHTARTFRKTYNNWHRFAVTPLASYWFWGLLPKENNRRKYE